MVLTTIIDINEIFIEEMQAFLKKYTYRPQMDRQRH